MKKIIIFITILFMSFNSFSKEKYEFAKNGRIIDKDFREFSKIPTPERYPDLPIIEYPTRRIDWQEDNGDIRKEEWFELFEDVLYNMKKYIEFNKKHLEKYGKDFILKETHDLEDETSEFYALFLNYQLVEIYSSFNMNEKNKEIRGSHIVIEKFVNSKKELKHLTIEYNDYKEYYAKDDYWYPEKNTNGTIVIFKKTSPETVIIDGKKIILYEYKKQKNIIGKYYDCIKDDFSYTNKRTGSTSSFLIIIHFLNS